MTYHSRRNRPLLDAAWCGFAGSIAVAVACTAPPAGPPGDGEFTDVAIQNISFDPKEITVRRGETVRWTNREDAAIPHTVTAGTPGDEDAGEPFDSETLNPGESFTETFDQVGEFTYFCRIHSDEPDMRDARVTVIEE